MQPEFDIIFNNQWDDLVENFQVNNSSSLIIAGGKEFCSLVTSGCSGI